MPIVRINDVSLYYEVYGEPTSPAVLLIQGLNSSSAAWPLRLVDNITSSGRQVVIFDNRDVGKSSRLTLRKSPSLLKQVVLAQLGLPVTLVYSLDQMALDAVGLLDYLKLPTAHVIGVSMGGMIAQHMAASSPERMISLTTVMSSSGYARLPNASRQALRVTSESVPANATTQQRVEYDKAMWRVLGSQSQPRTAVDLHAFVCRMVEWNSGGEGGGDRQFLAILADGCRNTVLHKITTPTLVIHGDEDPLLPIAHGHHTASQIRGARMQLVQGMGHDWSDTFVDPIWAELVNHFTCAECSTNGERERKWS